MAHFLGVFRFYQKWLAVWHNFIIIFVNLTIHKKKNSLNSVINNDEQVIVNDRNKKIKADVICIWSVIE